MSCLGIIPNTYISCGEGENFCSEECELEIRKYPDPLLDKPSPPVVLSAGKIDYYEKLRARMIRACDVHGGIGLASCQLKNHIPEAAIVLRVDMVGSDNKRWIFMLNPKIIFRSGIKISSDERCLSFPDYVRRRSRDSRVRVKYQTIGNITKVELFKGLESACVQHELEHCAGITIAS